MNIMQVFFCSPNCLYSRIGAAERRARVPLQDAGPGGAAGGAGAAAGDGGGGGGGRGQGPGGALPAGLRGRLCRRARRLPMRHGHQPSEPGEPRGTPELAPEPDWNVLGIMCLTCGCAANLLHRFPNQVCPQ